MSTRNVDADANVPAPVGIETTATALSHASERYLPPSELTVKYARGVGGGGGKGEHRIKTLESFYVRPRWLFVRVRCVSGVGLGRVGSGARVRSGLFGSSDPRPVLGRVTLRPPAGTRVRGGAGCRDEVGNADTGGQIETEGGVVGWGEGTLEGHTEAVQGSLKDIERR